MNRRVRRRRTELRGGPPGWLEELAAALMLVLVLAGILALGFLVAP